MWREDAAVLNVAGAVVFALLLAGVLDLVTRVAQ